MSTATKKSVIDRFGPPAAFHFSRTAAWAAIGILWILTPLCYLYVLWNLLTLIPSISGGRPAQTGSLHALNIVVLIYCAIEIPFSLYHFYLIRRAQSILTPPTYSRKFLLEIFAKSLENGLEQDDLEEVLLTGLSSSEKPPLPSENSSTTTLTATPEEKFKDESLGEKITLKGDDPRALDFQSHIRLWFHDVPFEDIWHGDMTDWISWSLYRVSHEDLVRDRENWEKAGRPPVHIDGILDDDEKDLDIEGDKLGLVEHCVELVEARAGRKFPPGRNPKIKVIRLTLDEVKVLSRPFILYAFVWLAQRLVIGISKRNGFSEERTGSTRYLLRIPNGWKPDRDGAESTKPLLFIHGLGMGVAQYYTLVNFLASAESLKDRPIVILIQPHISMSFFSSDYLNPPDQKRCTTEFETIAKKWKFDEAGITVLSHSNGTMVHGWLLKAHPEYFSRSCFVDPVCFCLWEPFVAFGFLYSTPRTAIEYLMRYYVSRELGIALMLQRYFDWSSNLLFPTSIPNFTSPYNTAVFMSGQDSILNATRIRRYLRRAGMKEVKKGENVGVSRGGMKTHANNKHGQSMIGSGRAFMQIMAWVTDADGMRVAQLDDSDTQVE